MSPYKLHRAGDGAIVVEFGDEVDPVLNARALSFSKRLDARSYAGIMETVPTFRSVSVYYDPLILEPGVLISIIEELLTDHDTSAATENLWRIPVCYDSRLAEDFEPLVDRLGGSRDRLINLHSGRVYSIYMLGFLPGQPYLGELAADLRLPRRSTPRTKIPAGSIGIATSLTSIFPTETPCGWHLIGRTPVKLWTHDADPRPLLAPGDKVQFEPISFAGFEELASCPTPALPVLESRSSELAA
jgi:KipI family sensor histidine kinase inhibitor